MGSLLELHKNKSKVISLPEELGGKSVIYGFSGGTSLYAIVGEEDSVCSRLILLSVMTRDVRS